MKKPRGFAALTPERRKEIAALGAKAVREAGTAHKFTHETAKAAGKKGGESNARRLIEQDKANRKGKNNGK